MDKVWKMACLIMVLVGILAAVVVFGCGCLQEKSEKEPSVPETLPEIEGPHDTEGDTATGMSSGLVEKLTLEQLTARAGCILVGTVTSIATQGDAEDKSIYTLVSISIEQSIKGDLDQGVITITVPGGEIEGITQNVEDAPSFQLGEGAVVFLEEQEDDNFSVVGGFQGKFSIDGNNMVSGNMSLTEFIDQVRDIMAKH